MTKGEKEEIIKNELKSIGEQKDDFYFIDKIFKISINWLKNGPPPANDTIYLMENILLNETSHECKDFLFEKLVKEDKMNKGYDVFQVNNDDMNW